MTMHRPTTKRIALIAFSASLFLTSSLLQGPTAALAQPPAVRGVSAPTGFDVVLDNKALEDKTWLQALHNSSISGVAIQIRWADLEPSKGTFNWSKLDDVMSAAESSKKWVHLLIFPGFFSPDWALDGARTDQFAIQYGPGKGTLKALPMPWDPVYLSRWLDFVSQVGTRYAKSPALRMVAADGPTSVSAEFTLPNSFKDLKQWQSDGYTPSKYLGAWHQVFQAFSGDFPNQVISLSEGACLGINDRGKIDHAAHDSTRQSLVDMGVSMLKPRFALQMSDVHAGVGFPGPDPATEDDFVLGYVGQIITGFQMRTSAEHDSAVMGAAGNPPLALRKSIEKGMVKNSTGQHVNYLEIYEPDVLATEMQPVLKYGASLFAP